MKASKVNLPGLLTALVLLMGLCAPALAGGLPILPIDDFEYEIRLSPEVPKPGQTVTATLYVRNRLIAQSPWQVFTGQCRACWGVSRPEGGGEWLVIEPQHSPGISTYTIPLSPRYKGWTVLFEKLDPSTMTMERAALRGFEVDETLTVGLTLKESPIVYKDGATLVISGAHGQPPFRYEVLCRIKEAGQTYLRRLSGEMQSSTEFPVTLTFGQSLSAECDMQDDQGRVGRATLPETPIVDGPAPNPMVITRAIQYSPGIYPGDTAGLSLDVEGGVPDYRYRATWYTLNNGNPIPLQPDPEEQAFSGHADIQATLPAVLIEMQPDKKSLFLKLELYDSIGRALSPDPWEYAIYHELNAEGSLDKAHVAKDGKITASVKVLDGKPPFKMEYDWNLYHQTLGTGVCVRHGEVEGPNTLLTDTLDVGGVDMAGWKLTGDGYVFLTVTDSDGGRTKLPGLTFRVLSHPVTRGDANDDGAVNIEDLTHIVDHLKAGRPLLSAEGADANADKYVNIEDIKRIIDLIVK